MDVIKAAQATLNLAVELGIHHVGHDEAPKLEYSHLEGMLARMKLMSDRDKQMRWLGWMQCAVYTMYDGDAESRELLFNTMKEINSAEG